MTNTSTLEGLFMYPVQWMKIEHTKAHNHEIASLGKNKLSKSSQEKIIGFMYRIKNQNGIRLPKRNTESREAMGQCL